MELTTTDLDQLWRDYLPQLKAYSLKIVQGDDQSIDISEEATEILQEAGQRLSRCFDKWDPDRSKFTTWVYAVMFNIYRERRRSSDDRHMTSLQDVDPIDERSIATYSDLRESFLPDCVNRLEQQHRKIILLWINLEGNIAKVSRSLREPDSTVRSQKDKAFSKVKQCVDDKLAKHERSLR